MRTKLILLGVLLAVFSARSVTADGVEQRVSTLEATVDDLVSSQAVQNTRLDALESFSSELDADLAAVESQIGTLIAGRTGVLVNSQGDVVGPWFVDVGPSPAFVPRVWVAVLHNSGNFLLEVKGSRLSFSGTSDLYYESSNCTGTATVFKVGFGTGTFERQVQSGSEIWKVPGSGTFTNIQSRQTGSTGTCRAVSFRADMQVVSFAFSLSELGSGFALK